MENQNNNDLFAICVLIETKDGNKLVFASAPTPDGKIAQNLPLLKKAKEENMPRLKIFSSGKISFMSAQDAFYAGKMKDLNKNYEDLTGIFEGSTFAEIVGNMKAGNRKDEAEKLTPEMIGDIDENFISF